ncbi:MAG: archease [Candidatus Nanohaloarchaea archaeon]|nr:archease [Candidatus Nanohaloarchaea archaeon]
MEGFKLLEHTSEVGFRATGGSLEEAIENAGKAVFQVMTDIEEVEPVEEVRIEVESESLEALLYDFVDELVYISEVEGLVLSDFDLRIETYPESFRLEGVGRGEKTRDGMRLQEVKAPTYSDMEIGRDGDGWKIEMFLDV